MVYVTAVMPYVILLILFIRGLFLEGATRGLFYFANPVMERLGDPEVRITLCTGWKNSQDFTLVICLRIVRFTK